MIDLGYLVGLGPQRRSGSVRATRWMLFAIVCLLDAVVWLEVDSHHGKLGTATWRGEMVSRLALVSHRPEPTPRVEPASPLPEWPDPR